MAGFDPFSSLASIVGGGLGFLVGGPMGSAVGSGLATAAYTGDIGRGIASGLLSYGLGSAMQGLGGFGADIGDAAGGAAWSAIGGAGADPTNPAVLAGIGESVGDGAGAALNAAPKGGGLFDGLLGTASRAAGNLTNPDALKATFIDNAMKTSVPLGMGALGMMMPTGSRARAPKPQQYATASTSGTGRRMTMPPPGYRPGVDPEYRYFADGGEITGGAALSAPAFDDYGRPIISLEEAEEMAREYDDRKQSLELEDRNPFNREDESPTFRFARGGYISGPGGGLDDAIPAIINGNHPASLSSGEYVVPAHAVSALGNGSTEEGVRQLDGMVDNTMKAKYGTKNRKPRPINPKKMMGRLASGPRPFAQGGLVPRDLQDYLQAYALMSSFKRPERATEYSMPMGLEDSLPAQNVTPVQEAPPEEKPNTDLETARERISRIESGGNYKALGPMVGKDRAYGRYQVMGANIPSWTKAALGREMTPNEYLADQKAQDAVFNHRFGGYMRKYGPAGAARAWFAGEGGMNNRNAKDVLGTSVSDYERRFTG